MNALVTDGFFAAAARDPARPAVAIGDDAQTYGALSARVNALARRIPPGARVGLLMDNSAAFIETLLAVMAAGGVAMVLEPLWTPATRAAMLAAHRPALVFADRAVPDAEIPVIDVRALDDWIAGTVEHAPHRARPHDLFLIVFTSGSTGVPKAVIRSHASWVASFAASAAELGTNADSRVLAPGPLSHGLTLYAAVETLNAGGMIGLQRAFDAVACARDLRAGRFDTLVGAPTLLDLVIEAGAGAPCPGVGKVITAGAKLSPALRARAQAQFPRAAIVEYYGASELSFVSVASSAENGPPDSVGRPFAGVAVAVRDDDGLACAAGEVGTVWASSAMLSDGYVGAATDAVFRRDGAWATVGDRGFVDARGFLHLVGRDGDMLISGGHNVYPAEVEAVLAAVPGVARCAVIGQPDPRWGDVVVAVIVPGADFELAAVQRHCRAHLARFAWPRRWLVRDALPLTPSGKVNRRALAAGLATSAA